MRARIPKENYRKGEQGEPSDHFIKIWEEVWDDELEKRHKENFSGK